MEIKKPKGTLYLNIRPNYQDKTIKVLFIQLNTYFFMNIIFILENK